MGTIKVSLCAHLSIRPMGPRASTFSTRRTGKGGYRGSPFPNNDAGREYGYLLRGEEWRSNESLVSVDFHPWSSCTLTLTQSVYLW